MAKTQRNEWLKLVQDSLKISKIVILQGLRRIGKTQILKEVLDTISGYEVIKHDFNIFGVDDDKAMEGIINKIEQNKDKKYLLGFDEFQDYEKWNQFFKTIYDKYKNVKIIATGSVSHNTTATNNTEGGRYRIITLPTLSFEEYKTIHQKLPISNKEMDYFWEYATMGSYPSQDWTTSKHEYKKQITFNIIEKIKDARLLEKAKIEKSKYVDSILRYLIENIGKNLSPTGISETLHISKEIVLKILEYLKDNHIIYEINNTVSYKGRSAALNNKIYLTDHTFYLFSSSIDLKEMKNQDENKAGFIFENIVANEIRRRINRYESMLYFLLDKKNKKIKDIDFVIEKEGKTHYFEAKLSESKNSLSDKQLLFTKNNKLNIIYLGEDITIDNKNYINIITFLKGEEKWI